MNQDGNAHTTFSLIVGSFGILEIKGHLWRASSTLLDIRAACFCAVFYAFIKVASPSDQSWICRNTVWDLNIMMFSWHSLSSFI
jgi:hypothetical protein